MNRRQTAGQILPLLAVCLGGLMGFAGVAVDVGFLQYKYQAQQVATDAAATGGAEVLAHTSCSNTALAKTAAKTDAGSNGYTDGSNGITVIANSPPSSGPFKNDSCSISVQIDKPNVATYFTRLFGYPNGMEETTSSVARSVQIVNGIPCIYLLSPGTSQNFNGVNVQAPQCAIYINDTANFNTGTVNAAAIGYAGGAPNETGATFPEATPAAMLPIADPCPTIPGCNYLTNNPPSTSGCNTNLSLTNYTGTVAPGCYKSVSIVKSNVALNGLYIFNGNTSFNSSTLTGTNTTLYVTANGVPPNFNGDTVNLAPPTSGNTTGVLYYQVGQNSNAPNFNGTGNFYTGLIYAPTATVNYNGTGGGYVVLVFGAINWNGSSAQEFATPPPGQEIVNKAVIVQ